MPQAYLHLRIARAAAALGEAPAAQAAYTLGAQGPDPLFFVNAAYTLRHMDEPALGVRMHKTACSALVRQLLVRADTLVLQSYALGFLAHLAADRTLHPYVIALTQPGGCFDKPSGHAWCEAALDTYFCAMDTGRTAVPAEETVPKLAAPEFAAAAQLMCGIARDVYGSSANLTQVADAYHLFRLQQRFGSAPGPGKRAAATMLDVAMLHGKGIARSHQTPAPVPRGGFPAQWKNPFTGLQMACGPAALCLQAAKTAAEHQQAARLFWAGGSIEQALFSIAPANCETGLPEG